MCKHGHVEMAWQDAFGQGQVSHAGGRLGVTFLCLGMDDGRWNMGTNQNYCKLLAFQTLKSLVSCHWSENKRTRKRVNWIR